MNQEVQNDPINNILAKCWADASFKQQLLADPTAALKAEGIEIPAGYTVRVLENTDKVLNYILPLNPNAELSDAELEAVAGGKTDSYGHYPDTTPENKRYNKVVDYIHDRLSHKLSK